MYAAYFKLSANPFAITPDPAFLYLSPQHQEAFGHLLYGTGEDGGFVQLTGEVGTGKTTVVRALLRQEMKNVDIALCLNPRLTVEEFLAAICDELKIAYPSNATLKTLVDTLNDRLLEAHAGGRRTVLIIDEAQNLSRDVLEQVRLLTNLETDKFKLLRIILVGQPELHEMLSRRDLRQLAQRITARYHLRPLTSAETAHYIAHRLSVAGGHPSLFTPSAVRAVHRRSRGIPRLINIICDRALLGAYSHNLMQVDAATVRRAAREALQDPVPASQRLRRIAAGLLLPIGIGAAGGVVLYLWREMHAAPAPVSAVPVAQAAAVLPAPPVLPPLPDTFNGAMQRLLVTWGRTTPLPAGEAACETVREYGLTCLEGYGDLEDLRRFNLPAALQLKEAADEQRHVVLQSLSADAATLEDAGGRHVVPLDELAAKWTGDFALLWRPPAAGAHIGAESNPEAVRWLRRQLIAAAGEPAPVEPLSGDYDRSLAIQIRRFQATHGLATDGVAGPRTLIVLAGSIASAQQPRLVADAAGEGG